MDSNAQHDIQVIITVLLNNGSTHDISISSLDYFDPPDCGATLNVDSTPRYLDPIKYTEFEKHNIYKLNITLSDTCESRCVRRQVIYGAGNTLTISRHLVHGEEVYRETIVELLEELHGSFQILKFDERSGIATVVMHARFDESMESTSQLGLQQEQQEGRSSYSPSPPVNRP